MTSAEFLRTYQSVTFPAVDLVRRQEAEAKCDRERQQKRILPVPKPGASEDAEYHVGHFVDFYCYRGMHPEVRYLNAWEFLML